MAEEDVREAAAIDVDQRDHVVVVDTGAARFRLDRQTLLPLAGVELGQSPKSDGLRMRTLLVDRRGREHVPEIDAFETETQGPIRTTLSFEGTFPRARGLRFRARLCFFGGTGLVRLRFTLHNPHRARHRGGLWDLGDPGSVLFRSLGLEIDAGGDADWVLFKPEVDRDLEPLPLGGLEIYQDSSGGENWNSRNHVNREGRVPCRFQGYRVRTCEGEARNRRASPVLALQTTRATVAVAVPEFWQQFPKSLQTDGRRIEIGLFPSQWDDLHELQGGEQKTHTVWLDFSPPGKAVGDRLDWVHRPARAVASPAWYDSSGVFSHFLPADRDPDNRLGTLLDGAIRGPKSFAAGREVIDEYGWRHWGDLYADHEEAHYDGPKPVISHYNNQFDVVYGAILQMVRTGDPAWADVFDPMARHTIDVDVYHTDRDRAAYNGGMFWFTDHYLSAETATHRTYSRANHPGRGVPYGGGPGCEHDYATGLALYYFLTGDREARRTVLELADWVLGLDDGHRTVFGLVDDGPTGWATASGSADYHGPGRGAGNSIKTLLDGWQLSGERKYLDKVEELIRRTIHPADDVAARELLRTEARWSYTIYLAALDRYLDVKMGLGELDRMAAYARASLVRYAGWMLDHEVPYFDRPEELEYPTEAWAAQEFRKAGAMRLAARWTGEPIRSKLLARGEELADRAWLDLMRFETRTAVRSIAVLLVEGVRDAYYRVTADPPAPQSSDDHDFGRPEPFVPQKARVLRRLKSPAGLAAALLRLANPVTWPKAVKLLRQHRA